jgi:ATP-dependent Clp endopeptidase proteolytic subunit ClpP
MSNILGFNKERRQKSFQIRSKSATSAEIILYGAIGDSYFGDSITAKDFSSELSNLPKTVNQIDVRVNSPGGDVFDGVTIYNRLKQHSANITVHIDGLAASIASIIALAGDEVIMGEGALFMIHLPWTMSMGDRNDLENTINRLLDVEEQLIGIYSRKTGLDRLELKKMLEDETWLDADQALEMGFVNKKVSESEPIAASALDNKWIVKKPKNFLSDTKVVKKGINNLNKRIEGILARK